MHATVSPLYDPGSVSDKTERISHSKSDCPVMSRGSEEAIRFQLGHSGETKLDGVQEVATLLRALESAIE